MNAAAAATAIVVVLAGSGCGATSRVATALVTQQDGQPCFALPMDSETRRAPVRLFSLSVTPDVERTDWRSLPQEAWGFELAAPGATIDPARDGCIRYGRLPPAASPRAGPAELKPGQRYRVEINARPADGDSSTLGYQAEFCLKAARDGSITVQPVLWDEAARRWRREVCAAP